MVDKSNKFQESLNRNILNSNFFNSSGWRDYFTRIAGRESSYRSDAYNPSGAYGYFQLMPYNRSGKDVDTLFNDAFRLTKLHLLYLNNHMTEDDYRVAKQYGIDMYGLAAGAHLGGPGGVLKVLRNAGNPKDSNGTSVLLYMLEFSGSTDKDNVIYGELDLYFELPLEELNYELPSIEYTTEDTQNVLNTDLNSLEDWINYIVNVLRKTPEYKLKLLEYNEAVAKYKALGGPININNPILNFSLFKGLLPVVRYSLGGRLYDSIIPSSNSVKPNLFYDGGDTMTSQFLDQVLAAREANLLRNEELAALYNFSPLAISDILLGKEVSVYTPDVVVTGKAPAVGFYPYGYHSPNKGTNYDGLSKGVLEMTPVIGDAMEIGNIGDDLYKGNYNQAVVGLGLMALPNILEKPMKYVGRKLRDLYNTSTSSNLGIQRFLDNQQKKIYSLFTHGHKVPFLKQNIQSLDPEAYQNIMHLVIDRNILEFTKAGVPKESIDVYKAKAQLILDNIKVGKYSTSDYENAGFGGNTSGFHNSSNPYFISTRQDVDPFYVQPHETRHALDLLLDDEILNPTSIYDKETIDLLEKLKSVKYNLNHILGLAYDDDFINLPNTKYAEGIKDYTHMDTDKITTNLDARNELIKSMKKENPELDVNNIQFINWGIDKYPDNAIFLAVYNSNSYGRRYIDFLKDNNKLTSEKAQQFREAMKHVGAAAAPVGIAVATVASLDNKQHAFGGHLNKFEEGGNTDDTKYQIFLKDLKKHAPNLANPSKDYNMRRYWELKGKPSNWEEAQRDWNYLYNVKEDPMFYLENDGFYHATSTAPNLDTGIGEFMKSANHPTVQYELNWYDNGDETGPNRLRLPSFEGFKSSQEFKQGNKYTPGYELKYSPIENKYYYVPKTNKKDGGGGLKEIGNDVVEFFARPTDSELVNLGLSYLPFFGSAMDIATAIKNPTWGNVGTAIASTGLDLLGGSLIKGAFKTYKHANKVKDLERALELSKKEADKLSKLKNKSTTVSSKKMLHLAQRRAESINIQNELARRQKNANWKEWEIYWNNKPVDLTPVINTKTVYGTDALLNTFNQLLQ